MEIWVEDSKQNGKFNLIVKKLSDLTGVTLDIWNDDGSNWGSENVPYPHFTKVDESLYFYKLYKHYLENTTEVVNSIVNIVNELNNV
jgi:hypothetical protein